MVENQPPPIFELDLGDHGDRLVFKTPAELRKWIDDERNKWQWVYEAGRPFTDRLVSEHNTFYTQLDQHFQDWNQYLNNPQQANSVLTNLKGTFENYYKNRRILNSTSPAAAFIFDVKTKRGGKVAAGAYAAILRAQVQTGGESWAEYYEGIVEAFLFKHEIDWTATAHQEALNRQKNQYDSEIARQNARFKELENKNQLLNEAFDTSLNEKSESLRRLHDAQSGEFRQLIDQHVQNLKAIETTYDQSLALQKPVRYWHIKESYHGGRSKLFGALAITSALASGVGLTWLAHWALGKLGPNENPKHWQLGVFVIGAFFAVWLVRVMVRLLFSHLHLATDAAERRMMILTFLAMSRQGAPFATEDKKLIIQHIFRSAADGLVKDDAAPPTLFELLTRK